MVTKGDGFLCHPVLWWALNPLMWCFAVLIMRRNSTPQHVILTQRLSRGKRVDIPSAPAVVRTALAKESEPNATVMDEILTNESILTMVKASLDETVILVKIATTPARFDTRTETLIELKRTGVADSILSAMLEKR